MGFLPPDDPRVIATVRAIADELTVQGLVLRYLTKETDDGLTGEEGSFTICSFWLVSALAQIGELAEARQLCEKLFSLAGPLGLYAEELDPRSGRHLGNYPQAFTHLAVDQRGDADHQRRTERGGATNRYGLSIPSIVAAHAAVDEDVGAGEVTRRVGHEERDQIGDLARRTHAWHRRVVEHHLHHRLLLELLA